MNHALPPLAETVDLFLCKERLDLHKIKVLLWNWWRHFVTKYVTYQQSFKIVNLFNWTPVYDIVWTEVKLLLRLSTFK